jgi:superfamily II DNA/RNA helicase
VVDETDHMADLGFLPVVRRLLETTPAEGQRMLFSATLDDAADVLARRFLPQHAWHTVDSARPPGTDHPSPPHREPRVAGWPSSAPWPT